MPQCANRLVCCVQCKDSAPQPSRHQVSRKVLIRTAKSCRPKHSPQSQHIVVSLERLVVLELLAHDEACLQHEKIMDVHHRDVGPKVGIVDALAHVE